MPSRLVAALAAAALFACQQPKAPRVPAGATLLYEVDFSAPEHSLGQPPAVVPDGQEQGFPSKTPSEIFFGNPLVVAKQCGLEKQPLQLSASSGTQGIEGVQFLLDQRQRHYHVELELCIAQLGPPPLPAQKAQLAVFLDIAEAYALAFMADGEMGVVDPNLAPETATDPRLLDVRWQPNQPMHLGFDFDSDTQRWQIAVDGKQVYDGELQMTIPRAVRVVLRGNPANVAAIDDFLVWGQKPIEVDVPAPKTGGEQ